MWEGILGDAPTRNDAAAAGRVIVVNEETNIRSIVSEALSAIGCSIDRIPDTREIEDRLRETKPQVLVVETRVPGPTAFEVIAAAHAIDPQLSVVLLAGQGRGKLVGGTFENDDSLSTRPVSQSDLLRVVNDMLHREGRQRGAAHDQALDRVIVGESEPIHVLRRRLETVARVAEPVLLTGEVGTGKSLAAHTIHVLSQRSDRPFVCVSCVGSSEEPLAREIFGSDVRPGRVVEAQGGTLFLDEISELPLSLQSRLVRLLDEQSGASTPSSPVDVRIVASSSRDLRERAAAGHFIPELLHRLCVHEIEVPPLRLHKSDIPMLAETILPELSSAANEPTPTVSPDVWTVLAQYDWPGNVRELRSALENARVLARGGVITPSHLSKRLVQRGRPSLPPEIPGATFAELERHAILTTYESCGHNATRTAEILGLSPRTIHYRLREYRGLPGRRQSREPSSPTLGGAYDSQNSNSIPDPRDDKSS